MEMTEKVREEVHQKVSPLSIKKISIGQGMNTLRENAVKKLLKGVTTVDEVIRVTGL
jgi:type II secretory ATPase GspE/PulE/Tfp pilus assembly ATPase PilB-like protein